ncbi:MAG TPA: ABC transporter substrate-binding protein [Candidatus Lokiarchaeia archaeon]|nr:ABC transporter substrate-binding protein [Candidatus Lokiarchaeia archaeon]
MVTLRIAHLTTAYHTSFILMGMGSGWLSRKLGVDIEWKLYPTGPAMVKAFAAGEIDLGYIGLPPAMMGITQGLPLKCVAGGHVEGTVIIGTEDFQPLEKLGSLDDTLRQFEGKAIGTPTRGSIHDVMLRQLLRKYKLEDQVEVRNFEWADLILDAIEKDIVQGGCGTPPLAVLGRQYAQTQIVVPPSAIWPYSPSYGIVTTEDVLETSRPFIEEFLRVHEDACNLIRLEPEKAADFAAKAIGLVQRDFLLEVYRVSPRYCASLPPEYIESTMKFVPVLKALNYILGNVTADQVFRLDLLENIHPDPPHYDDPALLAE